MKVADALSARADLGRNFAIITVGVTTGSSVAPPLVGALIEGRGSGVTFGAIAGTAALAILVTLFVLHRHGEESGVSEGVGGGGVRACRRSDEGVAEME